MKTARLAFTLVAIAGGGWILACGSDSSSNDTAPPDAGQEAAPPPPPPPPPAPVDAGSDVDACPAATITSVTPQFAWKDAATPITITGAGFVATPKVYLSSGATQTQLQHAAFVSATSMTAVVPSGAFTAGTYDLQVVNPDGCVGTLAGALKVVDQAPPTVLSVEPSAGTNQNDVPVTITGCHFDANATVSIVTSAGTVTAMPAPTNYAAGNNDVRCGNTPLYTMNAVVQTKTKSLVPGAYLVRVTNPTPNTFGDYSSFVVSNPSGNPGTPEAVSSLVNGRRSHAFVSGRIDDANRFLFAIGGENAAGAPLDTVEVAPLDRFGQLGKWSVQKNKLPAALSGIAAARWGKWIYVIGGTKSTDGTGGLTPTGTPERKVYRAQILAPSSAPTLKDPPTASATGTLAKGTWYYKVAAVVNGEELMASDEVVATLGANGSVKLDWTAPNGVTPTQYKIYRSQAADGTSQSEVLLDTVGAVLTYTDDGSKTPNANETYLGAGSTSSWQDTGKALTGTTGRLDASAVVIKAPQSGDVYLYVTGGYGTCTGIGANALLACVELAQVQNDGSLSDFATTTNAMNNARARHGTDVLDKATGPVAFVDGGAANDTAFLVVAGGRGTTSLGSSAPLSVEYAVLNSAGQPGTWTTVNSVGERDGLGFGIANGWLYAFVGGAKSGMNINYTGTAETAGVATLTGSAFTLGSWNSTGSFLSGSKRGRVGMAAESAYFYMGGGTSNDADALTNVYRVLH